MTKHSSHKVLIITYYWPPSGGSGVQRWLKFVKYLREYGWEPIIYTPENPENPSEDTSLLKDIPNGIEIIKRPIIEPYTAYKRFVGMKKHDKINAGFLQEEQKPGVAENIAIWLRGNFFIPDARRFWIKPSVRFLSKYLKNNKVDALVSTGPPHSMHLIAYKLNKEFGIPWLADFRDPWTGIYFYPQLKLSAFADKIHSRLEKTMLANANAVVVVTKQMQAEFTNLFNRKYELVTNGFDEEDIFPIDTSKLDKKFTLAHIGTISPTQNPSLLWKVIEQLCTENKQFDEQLQIKLIGKTDIGVLSDISKHKLEKYLLKSDYLPHEIVVNEMQQSQVLMLFINNTPEGKGILTGKLFEYLATGRPILCVATTDGDASHLIQETNSGIVVEHSDDNAMRNALLELFNNFIRNNAESKKDIDKSYSRRKLAGKIAEILNSITDQ